MFKQTLPVLCLFLILAGCKNVRPAASATPPDATYERLMGQAAAFAAKGQYDTAGTLYAQALDRAKLLDRRPETAVSALCLCAYAVNAEDAAVAENALRTYRDVAVTNAPTGLRALDLAVRTAWLKGETPTNQLKQLSAACSSILKGKAITPDEADASLTCDEALFRDIAAKPLSQSLPSLALTDAERQGLPQNIQIRYQVIRAWSAKDAAAWRSASRAYAAIGNYAAAFREALRCAKTLKDREAAIMALHIAEGMHDNRRVAEVEAVLKR